MKFYVHYCHLTMHQMHNCNSLWVIYTSGETIVVDSQPSVGRSHQVHFGFRTNGMTLMMVAGISPRASAEGKSTSWTTNETVLVPSSSPFFHLPRLPPSSSSNCPAPTNCCAAAIMIRALLRPLQGPCFKCKELLLIFFHMYIAFLRG